MLISTFLVESYYYVWSLMTYSSYLPVVFLLQEDGFQWLHELAKISPLCMDLKLWNSRRNQTILSLMIHKGHIWRLESGSLHNDLQYPTRMSRYLEPHWSCFCKSNSCVNVASVTQLSSPSPEYCLKIQSSIGSQKWIWQKTKF